MFGCSGVSKEVPPDRKPGPPKKEISEIKPTEKKVDIEGYLGNLKKSREINIEETLSDEALKIVQKVREEAPFIEFAGTKKDELISLLEQAIKIDPNYHAAYYLLGLSYESKKLWDKAIINFNKSIEIKPEYPEAYTKLGRIYRDLGRLEDAIFYYKKGIEKGPELPYFAHYELGITYKKKGQYEDAIREFRKAITLAETGIATFNLGMILTIQKQHSHAVEAFKEIEDVYLDDELYNEAIEVFNKELQSNPDNPILFKGLGYITFFKEEYKLAIQYFEKSKQLDERSFDSFLELGISYFHEDKYKEAKSNLAQAVKFSPNHFRGHMYLGLCYKYDWEEIDYDKALAEIKKAVEMEPKNTWALYHLGDLYTSKEDYDTALILLKKTLDLYPRYERALSRIAFVYRMKKNYDEAINYYKKALEIKEDAFTYSGLAEVYKEMSEYNKALEYYHQANTILKSGYKDAFVFDQEIAEIYLKQKNYREAIFIFQNLVIRNPKNTYARFSLAIALSDYGKKDEAIKEYLQLIGIDPKEYKAHYNLGLLYMEDNTKESLKKAIKHFNTYITETPKDKKDEWELRAKGLIEICNQRIAAVEYPDKIRELSKQPGEVGFIASLLMAKEDYVKGNDSFISGLRNTEPVYKELTYSREKIITEYKVSPDIFEAQALFKKFEEKVTDLKKKDDKYNEILDPFLKAAKNRIEGIEIYSKGYYLLKKDYRGEFEKGFGMIKVADTYFLEGLRNLPPLMKKYPNFFTNYDLKRISNSIDYYEDKYKK